MTIHRAIMEETHAVLKQTPKRGLFLVASNNALLSENTQLQAAKNFAAALKIINEVIQLQITGLDGAWKTISYKIENLADLDADPKAGKVEDAGAIYKIPELRAMMIRKKMLHAMLGQMAGQTRDQLDEFLASGRKQEVISRARMIAAALRNF